MSHRSVVLAVVGLALAVGLIGLLIALATGRLSGAPSLSIVAYAPKDTIVVHHKVAAGTHTYSGIVPLTACDALSTGISASGTTTARVTVVLTVLAPSTPCKEANTPLNQEFIASYAPPGATTTVRLDGITINGIIAPFALKEE